MLTLARTSRIDNLWGSARLPDDLLAVEQRVAQFMAAGRRSLRATKAATAFRD